MEEKEKTEIPLKNGNQDEGNRDEGSIAKQLVTETKTVQIPVTHEEVTIETRPPSGDTQVTGTCFLKREYNNTGKKRTS